MGLTSKDIAFDSLNRFTAMMAFLMGADFNSLRGITNMNLKWVCVYLAVQHLDFSDKVVADFYRVYVRDFEDRFADIKIHKELDDELLLVLNQAPRLWELITENQTGFFGHSYNLKINL